MSPSPPGVLAVAIIPTCGAIVAVAARFHVRLKRRLGVGKDDWATFVSLFLTILLAAILIIGVAVNSLGHHTPMDPVTGEGTDIEGKRRVTKINYAANLITTLTYGSIKLSVLLLYIRLFVGSKFRIYAIFMCYLITIWSLGFFFAYTFQCGTHPEYSWTSVKTIVTYCDSDAMRTLAFAVSDVVTDVLVLATPVPVIWGLQMGKGHKVGLTVVFGLGLLSTVAAIIRLANICLSQDSTTGFRDLIALDTNDLVWSHVEATIGVIAACLPTLKPLVAGKSPESMFRSLRSLLPYRSHGSETNRSKYEMDVEMQAAKKQVGGAVETL